MTEVRQIDNFAQSGGLGIELVVAYGREVESHAVHQCNHRIAGDWIHVVERIAGTVIASGEQQQIGVYLSYAVYQRRELRKPFYSRMDVVYGKNGYFFCLCRCGQCNGGK